VICLTANEQAAIEACETAHRKTPCVLQHPLGGRLNVTIAESRFYTVIRQNSVGHTVKHCCDCGVEHNVTDYDSW
jgi:hypothetical protein